MSIGNIGNAGSSFISPEENKKNEEEKKGSLQGHSLEIKRNNFGDKTNKISKSLPILTEAEKKEDSLLRKSFSDSNLEKEEHIYAIPRNSFEEGIYDVPRDFSQEEHIYETPKSNKSIKKEKLKDTEAKVKEFSSLLTSPEEERNPLYDYPTKPGESSFSSKLELSVQKEPIYESIEDLFLDLEAIGGLISSQEDDVISLEKDITRSLDECMLECEKLLLNLKKTDIKEEKIESSESKYTSQLEELKEELLLGLGNWKRNIFNSWKRIFSKNLKKTPSGIYYKQTTSPELEEIFKIPFPLSIEAREQLTILAEKQGLDLNFKDDSGSTILVMKSSISILNLDKLKEKLESLTSVFNSFLLEQSANSKFRELFRSILGFLEHFLKKIKDLIRKQEEVLEEILNRKDRRRSYSFDDETSSLYLQGTYKKRDDFPKGEEEDKL